MLSSVCSGFLCLGHFNKIIKMLSANWKTIIHLFKTFCVWAISTKLSKCALQTKKASSICSEFSTLGPSQQNRNAFIYFSLFIVHNGEYLRCWQLSHSRYYEERKEYSSVNLSETTQKQALAANERKYIVVNISIKQNCHFTYNFSHKTN